VFQCGKKKGKGGYTSAVDLWSLGVLTYVMLVGKQPFWGSEKQHLAAAMAERYPITGPPWDKISSDAKCFVQSLMKADPNRRMPITDCPNHPFLASVTDRPATQGDMSEVFANLKRFQGANTFGRMCIAAVARQLDHHHLKDIHRVFRDMDTNSDGTLSLEELTNGFAKLFGKDSDEVRQCKELFETVDIDGSQCIDYTEFCAAGLGEKQTTQDDVIWAAFKTFDLDNVGFVSVANLKEILDSADVLDAWSPEVCTEVAQEIITKYDDDNDGKIDFDDWKDLMQQCWNRSHEQELSSVVAAGTPGAALPASATGIYALLAEVNEL